MFQKTIKIAKYQTFSKLAVLHCPLPPFTCKPLKYDWFLRELSKCKNKHFLKLFVLDKISLGKQNIFEILEIEYKWLNFEIYEKYQQLQLHLFGLTKFSIPCSGCGNGFHESSPHPPLFQLVQTSDCGSVWWRHFILQLRKRQLAIKTRYWVRPLVWRLFKMSINIWYQLALARFF